MHRKNQINRKPIFINYLIVTAICLTVFLLMSAQVAATGPEKMQLNVETTMSFVGSKHFATIALPSDGYYSVDLYTLRPEGNNWSAPFLARFYSKDSTVRFEHFPGNWATGAVKDSNNPLLNRHEYRTECYLHQGEYVIEFSTNYGGDQNTSLLVAVVGRADAKYGQDSEPNNRSAVAVPVPENGLFTGYLGGYFENGDKDLEDWYHFEVPVAGSYPISIECDATSEGKKDMHGRIVCEIYNSETKELLSQIETDYSSFDDLFTAEDTVTFETPGSYRMVVKFRSSTIYGNDRHFGAYKILLGGIKTSTQSAGLPIVRASAETIQTGVKLTMPWLTESRDGYRIYRSEEAGVRGEVIATEVKGKSFIDVNVSPGRVYQYTICEVLADGTISEDGQALIVTTGGGDILGSEVEGNRKYILMKIGEPMMSVTGADQEIDPGRGTVPLVRNGRTLVPIRAIFEAMNGTVDWSDETKKITLRSALYRIEMWLEQKDLVVNGDPKEMDIAPTTINDRTMLPIRFVAENAGCVIEWIADTEEVVIVF